MPDFGMCLLLWTDDAATPRWIPLFRRLRSFGYASVDVPVFKTGEKRFATLGRTLDGLGLARNAVTALFPHQHLIDASAGCRRRGLDHLKAAIDSARALGASILGGPIFAGLGVFTGKPPTRREWEWAVEGLRAAAEHARAAGILLALEYLNRFEVYLVNCAKDARRLIRDVGHPSLKMMFDTFHANIEEKDIRAAIVESRDVIVHLQLSENDRSTPGAGGVDWKTVFSALAEIHYPGALTIEAFGQALPSLAAATKIWRPMFRSELTLAKEGLAFVRRSWHQARRASSGGTPI